jgi:hypothetical protein
MLRRTKIFNIFKKKKVGGKNKRNDLRIKIYKTKNKKNNYFY